MKSLNEKYTQQPAQSVSQRVIDLYGGGESEMVLSPDGKALYVACANSTRVSVLDATTGKGLQTLDAALHERVQQLREAEAQPERLQQVPRTGEPQKTTEQVKDEKIAALKQQGQAEQAGSTPAAASTVAGESKTGNGREGSGEQANSQEQPEESPKSSPPAPGLFGNQQTTTTRGNAATSDPGPKRGFQTFGGGKKP